MANEIETNRKALLTVRKLFQFDEEDISALSNLRTKTILKIISVVK